MTSKDEHLSRLRSLGLDGVILDAFSQQWDPLEQEGYEMYAMYVGAGGSILENKVACTICSKSAEGLHWEKVVTPSQDSAAIYLVCTALLTIRRTVAQARAALTGLMIMALAIAAAELTLGAIAARMPGRMFGHYPAAFYYVFSVVALLCAYGDARTLWHARLEPASRLARHIWRMSFAMWFATTSFFLGQAKVFPEPLRHMMGLRAIPVVLVLVVMFYWLGRVLLGRRRALPMSAPAPAR